jgi:hypothetical protein
MSVYSVVGMIRKLAFRLILLLFLLALIAVGTIGWVGSERALHPGYYRYKWSLASYSDLQPERIEIHSSTGIDLQGRFFPSSTRRLIVLVSGYGDTEDQMLPFAEFLHQAGFSALTFNGRARATSGGEYVTLTWRTGTEGFDLHCDLRGWADRRRP